MGLAGGGAKDGAVTTAQLAEKIGLVSHGQGEYRPDRRLWRRDRRPRPVARR
jgi:hypothetical protein